MTPQQIQAWVSVAQVLAAVGVDVASKIKALLHVSHDTLTPEQIDAAYTAILEDDRVRAALAEQASRPVQP